MKLSLPSGLFLPSGEQGLANERKFAGDARAQPFVAALLDARLLPDRYHPEDRINSFYFDTPDLRSWAEKDNGDNLKTKIRVRWYGRPEELSGDVPVYLEAKHRVGAARRKVRVETTAPASWLVSVALDDPSLPAFLARHADALGEPVLSGWAPTCCITYDRIRYNDLRKHTRVSVDWNVRADRFNETLFPWAVPVALDEMVCEFKNRDGEPPFWAEAMHRAGLRLRSFSKYGECMRRLVTGSL